MTELGVGVNKLEERESPLLSQEGWREAPGWFQSGNLACWRLRNHPSHDLRSCCPPDSGGQFFPLFPITHISKFIRTFYAPLH